jgi:hypothetical protein
LLERVVDSRGSMGKSHSLAHRLGVFGLLEPVYGVFAETG